MNNIVNKRKQRTGTSHLCAVRKTQSIFQNTTFNCSANQNWIYALTRLGKVTFIVDSLYCCSLSLYPAAATSRGYLAKLDLTAKVIILLDG